MASRIFWLLALQAAAVGLVWILVPSRDWPFALMLAVLAATYLWLAVDVLRGGRLLVWLKSAQQSPIALGGGLWAEVQDRVWRALRQRDRALADSEQRLTDFLAAMQASPNGVVLLNAQGQIEWLNDMASQHFGLDRHRDLMQHFANLVRDPAFTRYYAQNAVGDGVLMPGKGNTPAHPVRLSVQMHEYAEGRRLLLSRDVTAVEQAEAMRRDFVANVSHEIRTPLTVLSGFIETLQSLVLQEGERARYLGLMAEQAQRMQSLVSDLLTLSRLEGSPLPLSNEWVGVDALLAQCLRDANTLSELVGPREQPIAVSAEAGLELAGVHSELQSAMTNLLTNAVRYTPPDKEIQVQLRRLEDGSAEFCVRDQGVGIAQEHLSRLTERFYRVDRSRSRDTGGTGLGLAIVKHVVQRHGAELKITSTWGQGSAFAIRFPASRVRSASVH